MNSNPYESPAVVAEDIDSARSTLQVPAFLLLVLAVPTVMCEVVAGYMVVIDTLRFMEQYGPVNGLLYIAPFNLIYLAILAAHITVIVGVLNMLRTRGYRVAMAAAILSIIPILAPCYLLGIPIGVWAFIVLRNPSVAEAFAEERAKD